MRRWIFVAFSTYVTILMLIIMSIVNYHISKSYYKNQADRFFEGIKEIEQNYVKINDKDEQQDFIKSQLIRFSLQKGSMFVFLDKSNKIAFSSNFLAPNNNLFIKNKPDYVPEINDEELRLALKSVEEQIKDKFMDAEVPTYFVYQADKIKLLCTCYPFTQGERLLFFSETQSVDKVIATSTKWIFHIFIVILILSFISINFISRKINKSLSVVIKGAQRMANMNFEPIENIKGPTEIKVLRDNLNLLDSKLSQTINELNQTNNKLQKELDRKIKLEEYRKQFLSNASHELKTPLMIIQSYAEALIDEVGDENYYKQGIYEEAEKMSEMVYELLELSTVESSEILYDIKEIDFSDILQQTVKRLENIAKAQNHDLLICDNTESAIIKGDSRRLGQAIKNLIINAIFYSIANKPISVKLEEDDTKIILIITNYSENLSQEQLNKIWMRFFKLDNINNGYERGSGLGLSIVKCIIEKHNGSCETEYKDGKISFYITLPKI